MGVVSVSVRVVTSVPDIAELVLVIVIVIVDVVAASLGLVIVLPSDD